MIHINYAKIDFKCPYCDKQYSDSDDKFLNRCNSNKSSITKNLCSCGKKFGVSYNIMGNIVAFKLEKDV